MYGRDTTGGLTPPWAPLAAIALVLWLTPPWAENLAAAALLGWVDPPKVGTGAAAAEVGRPPSAGWMLVLLRGVELARALWDTRSGTM